MDSDVSWRRSILIAKYRYPNADQCTIIYLAKQIYFMSNNFKLILNETDKSTEKSSLKLKHDYWVEGANI